jgi:hypothetical protein
MYSSSQQLGIDICKNSSHRFVACLQALLADAPDNQSFLTSEDALWSAVSYLADDAVVGVRIGIARLVRVASGSFTAAVKLPMHLIISLRAIPKRSSTRIRVSARSHPSSVLGFLS